jgi:hypothetical protein
LSSESPLQVIYLQITVDLISIARSNNQKEFVRTHPPVPGLKVDVDTNDILHVGIVLVVGCGGLIVTSLAAMTDIIFSPFDSISHTFKALAFSFWAFWILVCSIANTVVSRTRSAKVLSDGVELPPGLVEQASKQLGISPQYWSNWFGKSIEPCVSCQIYLIQLIAFVKVRFYAIVTWITFFFAVLSAIVSLSRPKRESKA